MQSDQIEFFSALEDGGQNGSTQNDLSQRRDSVSVTFDQAQIRPLFPLTGVVVADGATHQRMFLQFVGHRLEKVFLSVRIRGSKAPFALVHVQVEQLGHSAGEVHQSVGQVAPVQHFVRSVQLGISLDSEMGMGF